MTLQASWIKQLEREVFFLGKILMKQKVVTENIFIWEEENESFWFCLPN